MTGPGRRLRRGASLALLVLLFTAACSTLVAEQLDQRYGGPDPARFDLPLAPEPGQVSWHEVDRVLRSRCAVCHGCYDAPCQLKLTAWEGVARGASPERVYDTRLVTAQPSRLLEDAFGASAWRGRGFHPVLNERPGMDAIEGSVLAQMLLLKHAHPNPQSARLPDAFDVSINRVQQCTSIEGWGGFAERNPLWGMPFGLPELDDADRELLLRWIGQGARREAPPAPAPARLREIERWEAWLNEDTAKRRLAARYLYEHLFLAHLYFGEDLQYYRLVRSRSAPGRPVDLIATRRPFDDPGVGRPYYRLVPLGETVVSKTHMPYRLDEARLRSWQRWFEDAPYEVRRLPGYAPESAANPFVTYADIPVHSRYRFLLDEAQFTVAGFIKGPVCRGQQALDVIDDHFWVFFADPEALDERDQARFLAANSSNLRLPAELDSNPLVLDHWLRYAEGQKSYLAARAEFARQHARPEAQRGARLAWDGRDEDGRANANVALTVFRHYDSASVEQGLIGTHPQSAWVISYPLLERLHYLLVAGYDVYGDVGHQLKARLYMDFLRIEGEQNFLSLLPEAAHDSLEQRWYRAAPRWTLDYVHAAHLPAHERAEDGLEGLAPAAAYETLLQRLAARAGPALAHRYELAGLPEGAPLEDLRSLGAVHGASLQWLPQVVLLRVRPRQGEAYWLTLLNNSAHKNVAEIFFEDRRRLPDEDTLTLVKGFLGAYPNAFWSVEEGRVAELARRVAALGSEDDYGALLDDFGIRRTNPRFWAVSDQAHQALARQDGVAYGLLDYNRLENR